MIGSTNYVESTGNGKGIVQCISNHIWIDGSTGQKEVICGTDGQWPTVDHSTMDCVPGTVCKIFISNYYV